MAASQGTQGDWTAVEMTDLVGRENNIEVSETVIVALTDRVFLQMATPQGIDPTDLILDLVVRRREPAGGSAMGPRTIAFAHAISPRQYATVTVRRDAAIVGHVEVGEVLS